MTRQSAGVSADNQCRSAKKSRSDGRMTMKKLTSGLLALAAISGCGAERVREDVNYNELEFQDEVAPVDEEGRADDANDDAEQDPGAADPEISEPEPEALAPTMEGLECLTLNSFAAASIDIYTGELRNLVDMINPVLFEPWWTSLAREGDHLVYCHYDRQQIASMDLTTGEVKTANTSCVAVTNTDEGLLVVPEPGSGSALNDPIFYIHPDGFDGIEAGMPFERVSTPYVGGELITVQNEILYIYSNSIIQRRTLDGGMLPYIELVDHDGTAPQTIEVVGDEVILFAEQGIERYSLVDGHRSATVDYSESVNVALHGLKCTPTQE